MFRRHAGTQKGNSSLAMTRLMVQLKDPDFREKFVAAPRDTVEAMGLHFSDEDLEKLQAKLRQEGQGAFESG